MIITIQSKIKVDNEEIKEIKYQCINKQEGQDDPASITLLPETFRVNWPFGSREVQYRFSRWRLSLIYNSNDFSYFWFSRHFENSIEVSSQLGLSVKEKKNRNRFSRWRPWLFWSTSGPDTSYQVSSKLTFWIKEKNFEIGSQDVNCGVHLEFSIGKILAVVDLQVTLILSTM